MSTDKWGTITIRRRRIWLRYIDEHGERQQKSTGMLDTPENRALAADSLKALRRKIEKRKQVIAAGGDVPLTLEVYGTRWADERIERSELTNKHASAAQEKRDLELYVYGTSLSDGRKLGDKLVRDVDASDVEEMIRALEKRPSRKGGALGPRTVCRVHGVLHSLLEHARIKLELSRNAADLPAGVLPARDDKDPLWRDEAVFAHREVEALISPHELIPQDRRTHYAVEFIAGVRWGESVALQWCDYDETLRPLHRLRVSKSFDFKRNKIKLTKTNRTRLVPVHPTLAKILAEWKLGGWEKMIGRPPRPDDLIFPNAPVLVHSSGKPLRRELQQEAVRVACEMPPTDVLRYRRPQLGLKRFHRDLKALGLRVRRNHDCRRTLNSLLVADGGRDPIRSYIVWGPGKSVADLYTTLPWSVFCEEMAKLKLSIRSGVVAQLPDPSSDLGTRSGTRYETN